jgi:uncharacterized protein YlxW (UPF0749 family)
MSIDQDLIRLKNEIDKNKSKKDKLKGELEALEYVMKDTYNVSTMKEAMERIKSLEIEIEQEERYITERIKSLWQMV